MTHAKKSNRSVFGKVSQRREKESVGCRKNSTRRKVKESQASPMAHQQIGCENTERFWGKVNIKGEHECWEWLAACSGDGYGTIKIGSKVYGAHRLSYILSTGEDIESFQVLHKCDNPICVNPSHLFKGTHADNMADRNAKGRQAKGESSGPRLYPWRMARGINNGHYTMPEKTPRGERHKLAKITSKDVEEIRSLYAKKKLSQTQIGVMYGITQMNVSRIILRKTWAHIL